MMNTSVIDQAPMAVWNGVVRFGIEIAALVGLAAGGWAMARGPWRWVLAFGLPLAAAVVWGTFRVPGDPGAATVAVPGSVRLLVETVVLGGGAAGFGFAYGETVWITYAVIVVAHYVISWDRIGWLLER
jgi:hypothetical protein